MTTHTIDDLVDAVREHGHLDDDQLRDAAQYGADAGFPGFTYTADGADFTRNNRDLIWSLIADEADDLGYADVASFVGSFKRADMANSADGFDCLLSWWALETAGRHVDESDES